MSTFFGGEVTVLTAGRRAGRFGTKGLAITFVSSDADQEVLDQIQARFEVKVTDLPQQIDSSSYSKFPTFPPSVSMIDLSQ